MVIMLFDKGRLFVVTEFLEGALLKTAFRDFLVLVEAREGGMFGTISFTANGPNQWSGQSHSLQVSC